MAGAVPGERQFCAQARVVTRGRTVSKSTAKRSSPYRRRAKDITIDELRVELAGLGLAVGTHSVKATVDLVFD